MTCNQRMEIRASLFYLTLANQWYRRGICTSFVCCKDYYSVLGVGRDATQKDIRMKFLELCKLYHPDKMTSGSAKEQEEQKVKFQELNEAYENLSKMDTRSAHDSDLRNGATRTRGPYRGGNYTGYTHYNRRRYEGKPPNPEDNEGWHSSWSEWDRYKEDDAWKKYSEDDFYRQQYAKNRKRWDDDLNKWSAYSGYYKRWDFGSNPSDQYRSPGPQYSNAQVVRACIFLLVMTIIVHGIQTARYQQKTEDYYARSRQYYRDYDDVRQNKVNREDLNERTQFINMLKSTPVKPW